MKKWFLFCLMLLLLFTMAACGTKNSQNSEANNSSKTQSVGIADEGNKEVVKRVASDDAQMQSEDPSMPTRVIENGTKINMHFGDVVIPGILNDSETAQALIDRLPYTVHLNRYTHDFCGVMDEPLPYSEENLHYGWLNGDIDFATNADYFTILFEDEEQSEQYGYQVNIGVIDCELSRISDLDGSYDVLIELAE